jgi:Tryptophan RNA-binding attenuator protein inhibitory protein
MNEQPDQLPELESVCPYCEGIGGKAPMYEDGWDVCWNCMGAGYVPTEFGKRVIALIRHQSKATVDAA